MAIKFHSSTNKLQIKIEEIIDKCVDGKIPKSVAKAQLKKRIKKFKERVNISPDAVALFASIDINFRKPTQKDIYTVEVLRQGDGERSWYTKYVLYNPHNNLWTGLDKGEIITNWYEAID